MKKLLLGLILLAMPGIVPASADGFNPNRARNDFILPAPTMATRKQAEPVKKRAVACDAAFQTLPAAGVRMTAEVRILMSPAAATMMLRRAEEDVHVRANPKYFADARIGVWADMGGIPQPTSAVVPRGMNVQPGDTVTFVTRHQDKSLPCHFVPNLVASVRHKA